MRIAGLGKYKHKLNTLQAPSGAKKSPRDMAARGVPAHFDAWPRKSLTRSVRGLQYLRDVTVKFHEPTATEALTSRPGPGLATDSTNFRELQETQCSRMKLRIS